MAHDNPDLGSWVIEPLDERPRLIVVRVCGSEYSLGFDEAAQLQGNLSQALTRFLDPTPLPPPEVIDPPPPPVPRASSRPAPRARTIDDLLSF